MFILEAHRQVAAGHLVTTEPLALFVAIATFDNRYVSMNFCRS